jgi:hypothetical protein
MQMCGSRTSQRKFLQLAPLASNSGLIALEATESPFG